MSNSITPALPCSPEAELGILACLIDHPSQLGSLQTAGLRAEWFHDLRLREVFNAITAIAAEGRLVCLVELADRLPRYRDILPQVAAASTSAANAPYWLEMLKENALRRGVIEVADRLDRMARDKTVEAEAIFADAEDVLAYYQRTSTDALPAITDASDFVANSLPPPAELILGVLHQGSKLVLGGGSKSFKTWSLLDLAISVSHGAPWLSFRTTRGRVLYLNMELPAWSFQQRISEIAKAKGVALLPGQLAVWNLRGKAAGFDVLFPKIKMEIRAGGFALIVLDPIYKLYGQTDENAAGDVAALMNGIEDLSVSTGAAVAFGAHFSKGNQAGKEAIDRISGSGVFARDPDSILILTKHEADDAFTLETTLRNFRPVEPFVVRWQFPLLRRDESLDPSRLKQAGGRKAEHNAGELLEVLPAGGLDNKEWLEAARDEAGITERTFYRLRLELQKGGKVLKSKINGKWQPITKTP